MSISSGMDVGAVRQLAAQFTHSANEIQQLAQTLTSQLENTPWQGPDRQNFENDWRSQHLAQLNTVVHALESAAQRAQQNALEQEDVSSRG